MSATPMTAVKTISEIEAMRIGGGMLATVFAELNRRIQTGMTTKDVADIAGRELQALGGHPTFLGYHGFPDVLCVSLNSEVVHGIPSSKREIKTGDIVSVDFGVTYQGLITDAAFSIVAGQQINPKSQQLLAQTAQALEAGIDSLHGGVAVGNVGAAVQAILDKFNLGIVRDMVGHGIGHSLHEAPNIPNYGHKGSGPKLRTGMTVAIEPMATLGGHDIYVAEDGWTVMTKDGSLSAHFEHTVLITPEGAEILTTL